MNETQKAKVTRFLDDSVMSGAVFEVVMSTFIKSKPNALVNEQAASFIAIGLLQDAWKELEKTRTSEHKVGKELKQVGL